MSGPGSHHHPLWLVRGFDAEGAELVMIAAQGPFDEVVSHMQQRDFRHVVRQGFGRDDGSGA